MARACCSAFTVVLLLLFLASPSQALYFYLDGPAPKCFYEELPKDTLVVGTYKALAYSTASQSFGATPDLIITLTVSETFDNDHQVIKQSNPSTDAGQKFTFSAADSGQHRLCFTPSGPASAPLNGWFSNTGAQVPGAVQLTLDMAIGDTSKIASSDQGKIDDIVGKVRDLNARLTDVKREQQFQREREAEFRDQSETTNSRVVKWTLVQLGVLAVTCAWQLSHLRSFFIKQKLT
ncbi:MAG: hypothetical protein Q9227_006594 [Pyrenula ochraceoflavens]